MKKSTSFLIFFVLLHFVVWGQNFVISGFVRDAETQEAIVGVSVYDSLTQVGTISNEYGFYSLNLGGKEQVLKADYASYKGYRNMFSFQKNEILNIDLQIVTTSDIEIKSNGETQIQKTQMGGVTIPISQLQAVPSFLGEKDLLKALALTAGISMGMEGTTGLWVRGGSPDQNLILLDGNTVYNVSHLFGFLSVFNPDAIKNIDLYKGSFPARYGGRLSSIVDITMKEGNKQKRNVDLSIGMVSSRLLYEGPIKKGISSYMFSARSSYFSLFLLPFMLNKNANQFNYWLYDVNAKVNHTFKDNSQLLLSIYMGNDFWYAKNIAKNTYEKYGLQWGNQTAAIRYNKIIHQRTFWKSIIGYTNYHYKTESQTHTEEKDGLKTISLTEKTQIYSGIQDITLKSMIEYVPSSRQEIQAGTEAIFHIYKPSAFQLQSSAEIDSVAIPASPKPLYAQEYALFVQDEIHFSTYFSANIGLRGSAFHIQDTTYTSLEPRATLSLKLPAEWYLKASFSRMKQYLHLLSNNGIGLPNDIWVPCTNKVPPQRATQFSIGISKYFAKQAIEFSIEAYQKNLTDLIDYQSGSNFLEQFNLSWQDIVAKQGVGKVSGIEVFAHKKQGRWNGWIAYTLAWNQRKFSSIDSGAWYFAKYDRRNSLNITGSYAISPTWTFSTTWMYASGSPTTLPIAIQTGLTGNPEYVYAGRNNVRLPAYHRLDIGFEKKFQTRQKNRPAIWSFGAYNVYNHLNTFFLYIQKWATDNGDLSQPILTGYASQIKKQVLFPILPYISYSIKF